jgi:hypothetical protein
MNKATLIQCTKSKRYEATPARDLYDASHLFELMREYAEVCGNPWYILSAKHGLVDPDTVLDPYDEYGLVENQCESIAEELVDMDIDTVEVIAGSAYTDPLTPALEAHGIEVIELCRGLRIGNRMQRLKTLIDKETHADIC